MFELYKRLAMAIVKQAVIDYHRVLQTLKGAPNDSKAQIERDSLEQFFRSRRFSILCDIDGEELMMLVQTHHLRLEVQE